MKRLPTTSKALFMPLNAIFCHFLPLDAISCQWHGNKSQKWHNDDPCTQLARLARLARLRLGSEKHHAFVFAISFPPHSGMHFKEPGSTF
jgi:hypothetical protein